MPLDSSRRRLLFGLAAAIASPTTALAECATCLIMDPNWQPPAAPQRTEPRPQLQATPEPAQPAAPAVQNRAVIGANELRLRLHQANGGWNFHDVIWANGQLNTNALRDLSHFMRDWRDGHTLVYSQNTAVMLARAQAQVSGRLLNIFSGVRSSSTNEWLRSRSSGVARNSPHLYGRAADGRFDGLSPAQTAKAFVAGGGGGVNSYDTFAHIDDGARRTW